MVLVSIQGQDVTMGLVSSTGHSSKHGSSSRKALKHQNNLRRRPRSWVFACPSIATGALDIAGPGGEGTGEQALNA